MTHGQTLIQMASIGTMNKGEMKKNKIDMNNVQILIEDGLVGFTKAGRYKNATQIYYITKKGQDIVDITKMVNGL